MKLLPRHARSGPWDGGSKKESHLSCTEKRRKTQEERSQKKDSFGRTKNPGKVKTIGARFLHGYRWGYVGVSREITKKRGGGKKEGRSGKATNPGTTTRRTTERHKITFWNVTIGLSTRTTDFRLRGC